MMNSLSSESLGFSLRLGLWYWFKAYGLGLDRLSLRALRLGQIKLEGFEAWASVEA